jgi:hypothetical protein
MSRLPIRFSIPAVLLLTASFSLAQVGSPKWTAGRITLLQGSNAAAASTARQQLMGVVDKPGFPSAYPALIAPNLLALLKSPEARTRLNAAVIAEHLAAKTASPALIPVASALLNDKSESLALWGIKTARPFIAAGNAMLAQQVATAVKAHADSGPMSEEAYAALVSADSSAGKGTPASLPAVLRILESRTPQYANGGAPPSPAAEAAVPVFLSVTCWPRADAAEQKQILSELSALACSAAHSIADGNANPAVLNVVQESATALGVIGGKLNDTALITAAKTLQGINLGNAAQMAPTCKSLDAAVQAVINPASAPQSAPEPQPDFH